MAEQMYIEGIVIYTAMVYGGYSKEIKNILARENSM